MNTEKNIEEKVYHIQIFHMLNGIKFHTFVERPDLEVKYKNCHKQFYKKGTCEEPRTNNTAYFDTKLPKGAVSAEERFLPYFATVTEDCNIPRSLEGKYKRKVYENCQLLVETHGGYMQFWHEPTKQVLRIALNSHIYRPLP